MNLFKKLLIIFPVFIALVFFIAPVFAAAPDGLGPWADSVVSSSQGLMKNGLPVPAARSDTTATLGVAENDTVDSHFFSLGFGGSIVLGFANGISSGVFVVEATNLSPTYPDEKAKIEVSENGTTWVMAGNVVQDGTVTVPTQISCAKFVRITDISDPTIMPDDIADGYDVDGVRATGDACSPTPTSTPTPTLAATPTPTQSPSNPSSNSNSTSTSSNGPSTCTSTGVTSAPNITETRRVSSTSIFVSWGSVSGVNDYLVQYGFQNGNWQFNANVSGTSTTINNLPTNQAIWLRVAGKDNCGGVGNYGGSVLVGGTAATNSPGFPNAGTPCLPNPNPLVPCFPNTGGQSPRLPNTGIGWDNNILGSIQSGMHFILSCFFNAFNITWQ